MSARVDLARAVRCLRTVRRLSMADRKGARPLRAETSYRRLVPKAGADGDEHSRNRFGPDGLRPREALDNERTQVGIDATMREVIGAANYNPNHFEPPSKVTVAGAVPVVEAGSPRRNGWAEPAPLRPPPGQEIIERLVNAAFPPGKTREN